MVIEVSPQAYFLHPIPGATDRINQRKGEKSSTSSLAPHSLPEWKDPDVSPPIGRCFLLCIWYKTLVPLPTPMTVPPLELCLRASQRPPAGQEREVTSPPQAGLRLYHSLCQGFLSNCSCSDLYSPWPTRAFRERLWNWWPEPQVGRSLTSL